MTIIGQLFTLIGIATIIATMDCKIVLVFIIFVILSAKIESSAKKEGDESFTNNRERSEKLVVLCENL